MKKITKKIADIKTKKSGVKAREKEQVVPEQDPSEDIALPEKSEKPGTIEEFIKLKKLQNQVLEKILENIKHSENNKKRK